MTEKNLFKLVSSGTNGFLWNNSVGFSTQTDQTNQTSNQTMGNQTQTNTTSLVVKLPQADQILLAIHLHLGLDSSGGSSGD